MYHSIRGNLTEKLIDSLIIDNNGIEYLLSVSRETLERVGSIGTMVKLYTYLQHTESLMLLFGFHTKEERSLFMELIKVSGIGPKAGIKILSGMSLDRLIAALENSDITALSSIPGLGKKTAQKLVLNLKGKLTSPTEEKVNSTLTLHKDLVDALVQMGYEKKKVTVVVKELESRVPGSTDPEEWIFREAIIKLSG